MFVLIMGSPKCMWVFYILISGALLQPAQPSSLERLAWGRTVAGKLPPGGERVYRVSVQSGAKVELNQGEGDFSIGIRDAHRKLLRSVDAFEYGDETATLATGAPAEFLLIIRRRTGETVPASYHLRISPWSASAAERERRIRAEDTTSEVRRLRDRASAENLRKAVESGRTAISLWRELGEGSAVLRATVLLADTHHALSEYDEARRLYNEALEISRRLNDNRSAAECLNNRGFGYWQQGSFSEAIDDLQKAREMFSGLRLQIGIAASMSNLGLVYWQTGEYAEALQYFDEALRALRAAGNRRGEMLVVHNLALTYGALGQYELSTRSFERAAAGFIQLGDALAAGRSLTNSARMYLRLNETRRAEANLRRGVVLIGRSGDQRALAEAWNLLGEVCARTGRTAEALRLQNDALGVFRKVGDRRSEANAITNLGLTELAAKHLPAAIERLREALPLHHAIGTPASEASTLYHLAIAQREAGRLDDARQSIQSAITIADTLRGRVAAEDLRISYLASTHDYYAALVSILMLQADEKRDPELVAAAWRAAECSRARALAEALEDVESAASGTSDGALWQRFRRLKWQVNSESLQLARGGKDAEDRRRHLGSLQVEMGEIEEKLHELDPRYRYFDPAGPDLAEVQREVLDHDTALLEYSLDEGRSYLWVVRENSIAAYRLPARNLIELHAGQLTAAMQDTGTRGHPVKAASTFSRAAASLASAVLTPALPELSAKRLLIVSDGGLQLVPFAALPLARGRFVIDSYEVVSIPSVTTLLSIRRRAEDATSAYGFAAIGDPVFDSGDARVKRGVGGKPSSMPRFARLPFSRREVISIAGLFPRADTTVLLGFEATREALTSGRLRNQRILHVATHATAEDRRIDHAALVFSLVNPDGSPRSGFLSAEEISALDLNADLVVLSACRTAAGR